MPEGTAAPSAAPLLRVTSTVPPVSRFHFLPLMATVDFRVWPLTRLPGQFRWVSEPEPCGNSSSPAASADNSDFTSSDAFAVYLVSLIRRSQDNSRTVSTRFPVLLTVRFDRSRRSVTWFDGT